MKKGKWLLAALAFVMVLGVGIGSAMAYFTTFVTAKGGIPINLGYTDRIEEPEFDGTSKHIVVYNEGPDSCYVRAKAFAGNMVELSCTDLSGGLWSKGENDDYWYYDFDGEEEGIQPVPGGEQTQELLVNVKLLATKPEVDKGRDSLNVVVIYESVPVIRKDDGKPYPMDYVFKDENGKEYTVWDQKIVVDKSVEPIEVTEEGGKS